MKKMRLFNRELSREEGVKMLDSANFGTLCLSSIEGYPYGVPLNFVLVGESLYFHCAKEGKKIDAIKKSSKVSFSVVYQEEVLQESFTTAYSSVMVFGAAYIVEEMAERLMAFKALISKYSPNFISSGDEYIQKFNSVTEVIAVKIEHLTSKSND